MLARLRARGAVSGFRGVRSAGTTVRRPRLTGPLGLRLASAAAAVPFLLGLAYLGDPFYGAFICIACAYAAYEVRNLLRAGGYASMDFALFATAILLPLDAWLHPDSVSLSASGLSLGADGLLLIGSIVVVSLVALLFQPTSERSLVGWALSLGLALYLGG